MRRADLDKQEMEAVFRHLRNYGKSASQGARLRTPRMRKSQISLRAGPKEEVCMEQVEKRIRLLGYIKWAGLALGLLMYGVTLRAFGEAWATGLGVLAACAFFFVCEDGKRGVLCEHIAEDLQEAMECVGEQDCIFEIKSMKLGLIIRVYFIKAGEMAPRYGKALIEAIARSWYRSRIWITQFVDLENEAELRDAEALLNEELLRNLKRQRDEQKKK